MRGILSAVNVNTLAEIPFLLPMARYPVLSPHTARPTFLALAAWVADVKPFSQRCRERGYPLP